MQALLLLLALVPAGLCSRVTMTAGLESNRSAGELSPFTPSGEESSHEAVRRFVQEAGETSEGCWLEQGERMGCKADCQCGLMEHCYPKYVRITDKARTLNVGMCSMAMLVLVLLSGV